MENIYLTYILIVVEIKKEEEVLLKPNRNDVLIKAKRTSEQII